jgi:predicted DNA-binding transcriptional regulator AlpA
MSHERRRLRTPEAAAYIGLAPRTLEKMRLTGAGPSYYKLGRAVIYDTREIDTWVSERARRSTSDEQGGAR